MIVAVISTVLTTVVVEVNVSTFELARVFVTVTSVVDLAVTVVGLACTVVLGILVLITEAACSIVTVVVVLGTDRTDSGANFVRHASITVSVVTEPQTVGKEEKKTM